MNNNQTTLQEASQSDVTTKRQTPLELAGQKILFDKKVTLMPVKLEKVKKQ